MAMLAGTFSLLLLIRNSFAIAPAALAKDFSRRSLDPEAVLDPANFLTRTYHAAIVVGDYLYIDGGQIAYTDDGVIYSLVANSSYSLDLSTSWTNETVRLNLIDKGTLPALNSENLWLDASGKSFYAYNGDIPGVQPLDELPSAPPSQLYKFTPDGNAGTWEQVTSSPYNRVTAAVTAYGDGEGYAIGGWQDQHTAAQLPGFQAVPGMVAYNMSDGSWKNITSPGPTQSGTLWDGEAHFLHDLGIQGVLLTMAGITSGGQGQSLVPFQNVSLFDPVSSKWRYQTTSGSVPVGRWRTCSVAAKGDNGTIEIFMYAGNSDLGSESGITPSNQNIELDAVYVLSLPSFKWFKTSYTPTNARIAHTCNRPGSNSRQMITIGGYATADNEALVVKDVWTQGLGVFDLTEMVWSDRYDANAPPYTTPQMIKDDYAQNGQTPQSGWTDPIVRSWFEKSTSSGPNGTNTSNSRPSSGTEVESSGKSSTPAIAGGVVGGIVGLALLAALIWYLRRRRSRRSRGSPPEKRGQELDSATKGYASSELPSYAAPPRHELDGRSRSELDATRNGKSELAQSP